MKKLIREITKRTIRKISYILYFLKDYIISFTDKRIGYNLLGFFHIKEYAKRLSELMTDDIARLKIAKKAHEKVKNFSIENIIVSWENLFKKLTT